VITPAVGCHYLLPAHGYLTHNLSIVHPLWDHATRAASTECLLLLCVCSILLFLDGCCAVRGRHW